MDYFRKLMRFFAARHFLNFLNDKSYLKLIYWAKTGKKLNLDNPKTFNEKLQWLKLNDRKDIYTTMVDKYQVKKYVSNIIGSEYIVPTLGVWDSFDDIDFDQLPNQFVLKCTHDSGGLVICKDKSKLDISKARKKINKSLRTNYFFSGREWVYKNVKPCIIAEQYLEDSKSNTMRDYKFFCLNGRVELMYLSEGLENHKTARMSFFDRSFEMVDCKRKDYELLDYTPERPKNFEKMIQFAEILSSGIPHLRVDFYEVDGRLYFGELTFFTCGGFIPFEEEKWNIKLGNLLDLKTVNNRKVCIVTVYNSINCGSFWQAYILCKYLERKNIEVVFYAYPKRMILSSLKVRIIDLLKQFKRNGVTGAINTLKTNHLFKKEQKKFKLVNSKKIKDIDFFILGSDTIWNLNNKRFLKYRNMFFGGILPKEKKKISYAASFANTSFESVNELSDVVKMLNEIEMFSVRDRHSADIINKITNKKCDLVCDPTLLYDKTDYECFAGQKKEKKKYILLYLFKKLSSTQLQSLKDYASCNGLEIIELSSSPHDGVRGVLREPNSFINYFYYADMIITDTFHGTMFSVNFEKNFYVMNRNKNKVNEFLSNINLNDRLIDENCESLEISNSNSNIAYNDSLKEFKNKSKEYLDLNICKNKI